MPRSAVAAAPAAFRRPAPGCGRGPGPRPRSDPPASIRCGGAAHVRALSEVSAFASLHVSPVGASLDQLSFCRATLCHDKPPRARPCNRDAGRTASAQSRSLRLCVGPFRRVSIAGEYGEARVPHESRIGVREAAEHERTASRRFDSLCMNAGCTESRWFHIKVALRFANPLFRAIHRCGREDHHQCCPRPRARRYRWVGGSQPLVWIGARDQAASCRESNAGPTVKGRDKSYEDSIGARPSAASVTGVAYSMSRFRFAARASSGPS